MNALSSVSSTDIGRTALSGNGVDQLNSRLKDLEQTLTHAAEINRSILLVTQQQGQALENIVKKTESARDAVASGEQELKVAEGYSFSYLRQKIYIGGGGAGGFALGACFLAVSVSAAAVAAPLLAVAGAAAGALASRR